MIIHETLDPNEPLTPEQLEMIKRMEEAPITFDEDCPELTKEQLSKFYRVSEGRRKFKNNPRQ